MKTFLISISVAAAMLSAQIAQAGFSYTQVSESFASPTSPQTSFGLHTVNPIPNSTGIKVNYDPVDFNAGSALLGPMSDLTDGQLIFTLMATGTSAIYNVDFHESGAYTLFGEGSVGYGLTLQPTIQFADGVAQNITLPSVTLDNVLDAPPLRGTGNWSLDLNFDVVAAAASAGISDPLSVTKMKFVIDNTLFASALTPSSVAFIDKKDFTISAVPEPSSFLFLGLVLGGTAVWKKRRKVSLVEEA